MEEEELEFVEELEAVLQLTPEVQLAIEQVSAPPPQEGALEEGAALAQGRTHPPRLERWRLGAQRGSGFWWRWEWVSQLLDGMRPL